MATPTHCPKGHAYDEQNTYWHVRHTGHKTPNCRTCQRARHKRNKTYYTEYARGWRARNKARHNHNWTELRKRKKDWVDQFKQGKTCKLCGESHPACLDFHHRDPNEKEFTIALAVARASLTRIQTEIAKCDIICSNCHRRLHWQKRQAEACSMAG